MDGSGQRGGAPRTGRSGSSSGGVSTTRRVIELVRSSQRLPPDEPLGADAFLLERGLALDSVALLELMLALEEGFELRIEDHELTRENFETVAALAQLIDRKLAGSPPADA